MLIDKTRMGIVIDFCKRYTATYKSETLIGSEIDGFKITDLYICIYFFSLSLLLSVTNISAIPLYPDFPFSMGSG